MESSKLGHRLTVTKVQKGEKICIPHCATKLYQGVIPGLLSQWIVKLGCQHRPLSCHNKIVPIWIEPLKGTLTQKRHHLASYVEHLVLLHGLFLSEHVCTCIGCMLDTNNPQKSPEAHSLIIFLHSNQDKRKKGKKK